MNEERYIELLNAEIDDGLGEDERRELDACLEQNAEARKFQADLRSFATLMNSVPQKMPVPGLGQKIVDQVRLPSRRVFKARSSSTPFQRGAELGLAFAAGLLLAVAIYQFVPGQYPDRDFADMVGTLVAGQDGAGSPTDDSLALDSDEVTAAVSMRHVNNVFEIEFDLKSDETIDLEADFSGAGLEFGGFARRTSGIGEFQVSGGILRVTIRGDGQFALFLQESARRAGDVRVEIRLFANGEQVYRGALETPQ